MDNYSSPPIFAMSGQDALRLIRKANTPYIKGLKSAADYLGVSRSTICRLKRDGLLDGTFGQFGHVILFDKNKLSTLLIKKARKHEL